jgi:histidine ammonia-lyase
MDFRRPLKTSPFLEKFMGEYRKEVSFVQQDELMYKGINKTIRFLNNTEFKSL